MYRIVSQLRVMREQQGCATPCEQRLRSPIAFS
jgi:hypothetical protein